MDIVMRDVIAEKGKSQEAAYKKLKDKLDLLYEDFRKGVITVRFYSDINQWQAQCVVCKYED